MALYEYQQRVRDLLLDGQSVILQAPTGSGKTRAALTPFFERFRMPDDAHGFPVKCLYAVPMRVLANQFLAVYGSGSQEGANGTHRAPTVKVQTGERPDDPQLRGDLVFATIDQVLSSYLHMPYALSRRQANVNAGAVVSSYLVFDEFHLFDPMSTLPTTLEMLQTLRGVTPFLLMTATFSTKMLNSLAGMLGATVVPEDAQQREAMLNLPVERSKRRHYRWTDEPISARAVLERHEHRSLAICNTVERAQDLYRALRDSAPDGAEVILLHSRFLPEDRAAKERRVRELFGKDANRRSGSVIAVATQVIEVGLDISAQALHTELAPANSVLQRAGRCARFQGETGEVFAYAPENALPYQGQEAVMARTSEWLLAHQGERVDFQGEQSLVDWAHAEADRDLFDGLRATRRRHGERMRAALNGDRASAGELIRKIAAQQLTISAQPDLLSAKPFEAPLFSLHPGSIESAAKRWLAAEPEGFEVQERIWRLIEADEGDEYDARYGWSPIRHPKEVIGASLIAVHPDLAAYDADEGLSLKRGGRFRAEAWMCRQSTGAGKAREPKFYRLESYQEHRRLVLGSHLAAWRELASAAGRLEARAGWPKGQLALAAAMVAALHDAGKLTVAWQSWVSDWQSSIGRPLPNGFLAAHTDYDEGLPAHVELQRQMRKRPPHAVEGAVVVARVLALALAKERRLLRATFSAIARHHGPFASGFSAYRIRADAPAILLSGLPAPPGGPAAAGAALRLKAEPASTAIDSLLVDGSDGDELLAYMLLARALRLADQEGTRLGSVGA